MHQNAAANEAKRRTTYGRSTGIDPRIVVVALGVCAGGNRIGCGLGNIWRFPYITGENGGGAFVVMYFVLAFFLAYPALMAELVIGRHTRSNMVDALDAISGAQGTKRVGALTVLSGL